MSTVDNFPNLRPSLLLDFANSGRVDPRIQSTRASSASYYGSDGKLRTVPANVARINYEPATGRCLGLLCEDARTNILLQSNILSNAAWNKTASLTVTAEDDDWWDIAHNGTGFYASINQTGRPNTNKYAAFSIDLKAGSLGSANLFVGFNGTVDGARVVFDLVAGTSAISSLLGVITAPMVTHSIKNMGGFWRCSISVDATATAITPSTTTCLLYPGAVVSAQVAGNIKARRAQLESATFPTSYIDTAAAAVTRAADAPFLSGSIPGFNPERGTLIVSYDYPADNVANMIPLSLDAGTQANSIALAASGFGTDRFLVQAGGVGVFNSGFTSFAAGVRKTSGIAFGGGRISVSSEGRAVVAVTGVAMPVGLNRITLGHSGYFGSSRSSGHIARLAYYPVPVTDAQLQRLTA